MLLYINILVPDPTSEVTGHPEDGVGFEISL